jgi:hypothetical protein
MSGQAEDAVVLTEPFWMHDSAATEQSSAARSAQRSTVGVLAAGLMPVRDIEFVLPFAADRDRGAVLEP